MHIGTCGFPVARKKYFREFSVIEIQKTFYTPISEKLANKWKKESPENFIFTLKAPQTITHPPNSPTYKRYKGPQGDFGYFRTTKDVMDSWENFVKIAKILDAKFIVFQTPASFKEEKENIENIYSFFQTVKRITLYGWEPRGKWKDSVVKEICRELELVHVVDPFKHRALWGDISYYRLHGKGGYNYRYSNEELKMLAKIVKEGDFVMFNNTYMWENALEFKHLLEAMRPHS